MWLTKHASKMRVSAGRSHCNFSQLWVYSSWNTFLNGLPPGHAMAGFLSRESKRLNTHVRIRYLWVSAAVRFSNIRRRPTAATAHFFLLHFPQKKKFQKKSVAGGGAAADDSVVGPGRSLNMNMNRRRIVQFCKKWSARRPDGKK